VLQDYIKTPAKNGAMLPPFAIWRSMMRGVSGAAAALPLELFYIDGVSSLRPSNATIAQAVSYPNNDFEMTGSAAAGSKIFTRSGGDPAADAGTSAWWVAVEHADGTLDFNAVKSAVGDVFTMAHPFAKTVAKLHQAHQENLGQHWSPKGAETAAEYVYNITRQASYFEKSQYSLWAGDEFATDPWNQLSTDKIPEPFGGAANNSINYLSALNPWTATKIIHCEGVDALDQNALSVGHGFTVDIATNGKESFFRASVGGTLDTAVGLVEILFDSVPQSLPDGGNFGAAVYHIGIAVPSSVATVTYRAKRLAGGGSWHIRVGGTYMIDLTGVQSPAENLIAPSSRVGLFGDSYFDKNNTNGLPFHNKFAALHPGFLSNHAIGGSQISTWIASLAGWLASDNLDIAIMHSGINELSATPANRSAYWVLANQFISTCKASGVTPVIFSTGAIADDSKTSNVFRLSAFDDVPYLDRWPQQIGDWHDEATTSEIANTATARINLYKKVGGKTITRLNDSATLTAAGSAPTDIWS
jgi:hypothetical protein